MPNRDGTGSFGGGKGRMNGPLSAGPSGECVCQQCGYNEPHQRGQPCNQKRCPKCGKTMTRH